MKKTARRNRGTTVQKETMPESGNNTLDVIDSHDEANHDQGMGDLSTSIKRLVLQPRELGSKVLMVAATFFPPGFRI